MRKDKMFALKKLKSECEDAHMDLLAEALAEAIEAVEEKELREDDKRRSNKTFRKPV